MIPDDVHLQIGSLLFEGIDQIDVTGPFEVFSRLFDVLTDEGAGMICQGRRSDAATCSPRPRITIFRALSSPRAIRSITRGVSSSEHEPLIK
jgi:hypothetical protein